MRETIRPTRLQRERRAARIEPEKPIGKFDKYLKYAPLAYLCLIVYSYTGLNAYYSVFGVDILGHMSIQELLISPLKSVHLVVLFCLLFITTAAGIVLETRFEKLVKHGIVANLRGIVYSTFIIFLLFLLLMFILTIESIEYGVEKWQLYAIAVCLFLGLLVAGYSKKKLTIELPKHFYLYKTQFYLALIFVFLLTINYSINYIQAADQSNKRTNRIARVHFGGINSTFVSGIFLGETNSTIFILSDSLNHAKAYMKKDIRLVEYPVRQKLKMTEESQSESTVDSLSVAKPDTLQFTSQDSLKNTSRP